MSNTKIVLELTDDQAMHLWGILIGYSHDTRQELVRLGIFTKQGIRKQRTNHLSDLNQERVDNVELADLIYKYLEQYLDFSELEAQS